MPSRQYLHQLRYPERAKARVAVAQAIKRGQLVRQPCAQCGDTNSQAHHPDYSKPLLVEWLCGLHHRATHQVGRSENAIPKPPRSGRVVSVAWEDLVRDGRAHEYMDLQSVASVASILGLSARRIRQIMAELDIRPGKIGTAFIVSQQDVTRIHARNRKPGPKPNGSKHK